MSIALEGPCCAGKTTLGHGLMGDLAELAPIYVRDYSDYVGGGKNLPPPVPVSLTEERRTLRRFLRIEAARTAHCQSFPERVILIDRSIHTLLAHCYALERITHIRYSQLAKCVLLRSSIPLWPSFMFYLDIPNEVVMHRNRGKFPQDSIFINLDFNIGIREYFEQLAGLPSPHLTWIDATKKPHDLRGLAKDRIRKLLDSRTREDEVP